MKLITVFSALLKGFSYREKMVLMVIEIWVKSFSFYQQKITPSGII